MRILITGKTGQLGKSIQQSVIDDIDQAHKHNYTFIGRDEIDFSDNASILAYFEHNSFDVIIHCAAFTQVERAEHEQDLANQINHLAVEQLARIAHRDNIKLIHISTDYVFDGNATSPYTELDTPNPGIFYAKTKLLGEQAVQNVMINNAIILRIGWIYSQYDNNFVNSMSRRAKNGERLKIVTDQIGTPVYVKDLIATILHILNSEDFKQKDFPTNVYHYSNLGQCSWYEFAKEVFSISGIKSDIIPITTEESPSPIKRPLYTVLNKDKISKKFNIEIPTWQSSLKEYLELSNKNIF
jgi:dTDP-4-dehydrorhamnose reductase